MHRVIKPRNKWESIILKTVYALFAEFIFACQSEMYERFFDAFNQLDTTLIRYPHTESDLI